MRVAITGAAGYIGNKVIQRLENDGCEAIIGVSRRTWNHPYDHLEYHSMDVRSPHLSGLLESRDIDALVHLAFVVNPLHNQQEMHSINVAGTRNVLEAAAQAGVDKVIVTSSTMVYGAWPDNTTQLSEDTPLRGHPTYYYNKDKVKVEHLCQEFQEQYPEVMMTILRPCLVLGPTVDQFYSRLFNWPLLPIIGGSNPPLQFVHEDDVARAYHHFLARDVGGTFNITGSGTMTWREIIETAGKRAIRLPAALIYPLVTMAWHLHLIEVPPQVLDFVRYPWVASNQKAQKAGFIPQFSTQETLVSFLGERKNF